MTMEAFGTRAPLTSVTVPVMVALVESSDQSDAGEKQIRQEKRTDGVRRHLGVR